MNLNKCAPLAIRTLIWFAVISTTASIASADWKEKVLYSFQGIPDGAYPTGGVVFDKAGNLYGATSLGGADNCPGIAQCGIVYQLKPPTEKGKPWSESVLYVFKGVNSNDGNTPEGGVVLDQNGNVYGTTAYGGTGKCRLFQERVGCGTVFELTPPQWHGGKWTEKVLHSFQSGKDGYFPWGDLTFDSAGNLYGATQYGGGYGSCNAPYYQYCGTVFKLTLPKDKGAEWTEQVLYAFKAIEPGKQFGDGANPNGGLVLDTKGAIYGTTYLGGYNCPHGDGQGCGTGFMLLPPTGQRSGRAETIIHRFSPGNLDGGYPTAGLVLDSKDQLYGTTQIGGPSGNGTVFRLTSMPQNGPTWNEEILYGFHGREDGGPPMASVVLGPGGDLYGNALGGIHSSGTLFRLAPPVNQHSWTFMLLYSFEGTPDGRYPAAEFTFDAFGNAYSTTQYGGSSGGYGTVFKIEP